ncbi:MAG: hypothetical protein QOG94_348 [Solirubrobacteraceae bacterium]|jgi:hypothetical protein|nr:hypothetical protein [Solirubrobacteraceae bacterium]MEA2139292.1 hypothetical protein [Solirubrobacteraceae bacterium]
MDLLVLLAAAEHLAEEHERSELPFFIAGGMFAAFAIAISVFGFQRPDFPSSAGQARGVMSAGVVLMLAAISAAVYVAL